MMIRMTINPTEIIEQGQQTTTRGIHQHATAFTIEWVGKHRYGENILNCFKEDVIILLNVKHQQQ
jgi:hypothetical protein